MNERFDYRPSGGELTRLTLRPTLDNTRTFPRALGRSDFGMEAGDKGEIKPKVPEATPRADFGRSPEVPLSVVGSRSNPIIAPDLDYSVIPETAEVLPEGSGPYDFLYVRDLQTIGNEQLRAFATNFRQKPLGEWSTGELKDLYRHLQKVRLEKDASMQEKEDLASDSQPYGYVIITELDDRLRDTGERVEDFIASVLPEGNEDERPLRPGSPVPRPGGGRRGGPRGGGGVGTPPLGVEALARRAAEAGNVGLVEYFYEYQEIFSNPDVRRVLASEKPDFSELHRLKEFMEGIRIDSRDTMMHLARLLVQDKNLPIVVDGTLRNDVVVSPEARRVLYEWLWEKIYGLPDADEEAEYHLPSSLELSYNMTELETLAQTSEVLNRNFSKEEEKGFFVYLMKLANNRKIAHELYRLISLREQYKQYIVSGLRSEGLHFLANDIAGVAEVIAFYEKVDPSRVSDKKEWFDDGDMKGNDKKVEKLARDMFAEGSLIKNGRILTEWEFKRALRMGRTFMSGTQRRALYSGFGDLPKVQPYTSIPHEYIARDLMPYKTSAPRYFYHPKGSKALMQKSIRNEIEMTDEEYRKDVKKNGVDSEKQIYIGLFGVDKFTEVANSYGAQDASSHNWRSQALYLGNIHVTVEETVEGRRVERRMTLLDYLYRTQEDYGGEIDEGSGILNFSGELDKKAFREEISDQLLSQRLYLSNLIRYGGLNNEIRTKLWQKRAVLNPSTIASLQPDIVETSPHKALWPDLRDKLMVAENKRVFEDRDYEKIKDKVTIGERLTEDEQKLWDEKAGWDELAEFRHMLSNLRSEDERVERYKYQIFNYFGKEGEEHGLKREEEELLIHIIDQGIGRANLLAKAKMFHAVCIDDAPVIAYAKKGEGRAGLGNENLLRLYNDQANLTEGWNSMVALTESPQTEPIKHMAGLVEGLSKVISRSDAQRILAPHILAYIEMGKAYTESEFIRGFMHFIKRPTSDLEKYFRSFYITLPASERAKFLDGLAQQKAVADEVIEGKPSPLDEMKRKAKAERWRIFMIDFLKFILEFLGPAAFYQFIKIIMPDETQRILP